MLKSIHYYDLAACQGNDIACLQIVQGNYEGFMKKKMNMEIKA